MPLNPYRMTLHCPAMNKVGDPGPFGRLRRAPRGNIDHILVLVMSHISFWGNRLYNGMKRLRCFPRSIDEGFLGNE